MIKIGDFCQTPQVLKSCDFKYRTFKKISKFKSIYFHEFK